VLSEIELRDLVAALRQGQVVACATETFFGLLADARNPEAVARVCALKGRDAGMPIAVLLPDVGALDSVCEAVDEGIRQLAARHWPGPLTLLLRARPGLPPALVKDAKIGVRVPGESPALQLTRAFGAALTATSANLSGQPAARTASDVAAVFSEGLAAIVGTEAPGGLASTIIDVTGPEWKVVRAGPVQLDDLTAH
jgi:L-threonylcarbamoyladenylate synthase